MVSNVQGLCARLGAEGCYELSLMWLAERIADREIDVVRAHAEALRDDIVAEDCFVKSPERLLLALTGARFKVVRAGDGPGYVLPLSYVPLPGEYEVLRFERQDGRSTIAHFVVGDGHGGVAYDPYEGSRTVREGILKSKRIVRREA